MREVPITINIQQNINMLKKCVTALLVLSAGLSAHAADAHTNLCFAVNLLTPPKNLPGELVFADLNRDMSRAYFLWKMRDGSNSLELATVHRDADGETIHLHVNEAHSLSAGLAPCEYSAVFNRDTATLDQGLKWPHGNAQLWRRWSGTLEPGGPSETNAAGNLWISPRSDLTGLLRELTDSYKLGNVHVHHFPSPEELTGFTNAADYEVAKTAKIAIGISDVLELVADKLDLSAEERKFKEEMADFAVASLLGNANSLSEQFFGSGGALSKALEERRQAYEYGPATQYLINVQRRLLTALVRAQARSRLPAGQVSMRFTLGDSAKGRITPIASGSLLFENEGPATLHGVNLTFDLARDPVRIDANWEREQKDWNNAGMLNALSGMASDINDNGWRARELQYEILKVGVTGMVYVPEWPPHTPVEIRLDSLGNLERYAIQVTGTVTATEGTMELAPVAGLSMVNVIKNAVRSQGGYAP